MRIRKYLLSVVLIATLSLLSLGCPTSPPDFLVTFLLSTTSLDFGTDINSLQFKVSKNYTSKPMPTFTVTPQQNWILVNPSTGNSNGPSDPATITVSLDRSKLTAGANTGSVVVSAPGVTPVSVTITATTSIVANFGAITGTTIQPGGTVSFQDQSTVTGGTIDSWLWTFGDGGQSNQQNPTHQYNALGTYDVTLTVTSGALSDVEVKANYISVVPPTPPDANFSAATTTPLDGNPLQFTDLSSPGTSPITSRLWDFGDGGTSTAQNPIHTYTTVGTFDVSLTVTTLVGPDTETKTGYITVQPKAPTANFDADDRTPAVGQTVQFSDLSTPGSGTISEWWWHFGDGVTSTLQNPTHIYTAAKAYSVYLGVRNSFSQLGTKSVTNFIQVSPTKTMLDNYVSKADNSYGYSIENTTSGTGYTAYVVNMTSQTWKASKVTTPAGGVWKHWLTIIDPTTKTTNTALLVVSGGSNTNTPPTVDLDMVTAATQLGSTVAVLSQVPNEPMTFAADGVSRTEDSIIAYTLDKFIVDFETMEKNDWPLLLPMTKSAVRAMDTVQDVLASKAGKVAPTGFVVVGASKRGWTTWLTAAVDSRVIGAVPIVIDMLNMKPSMSWHYQAYGTYSEAVEDYWKLPPAGSDVFSRFDTPESDYLMNTIDPYSYRTRLTMPKFVMCSTGDQFFVSDSAQFYFSNLPGSKFLYYAPNTDHGMDDPSVILPIIAPFFGSVAFGVSMPTMTWNFTPSGGGFQLTVTPADISSVASVKFWSANTLPTKRDFRLETIGAAWGSTTLTAVGNQYTATIANPGGGKWKGGFAEVTFNSPFPGFPYRFCTELRVAPTTMPSGPPPWAN
ncbi:MAG: PhoPQ-activated protein PqaA family protein [Candidatus Hydrogenedentales bacterium]